MRTLTIINVTGENIKAWDHAFKCHNLSKNTRKFRPKKRSSILDLFFIKENILLAGIPKTPD
jgi:hypothetical protein